MPPRKAPIGPAPSPRCQLLHAEGAMLYRARPAPVLAGTALLAGVAELVDARDLGSRDESRGGSSPSARTTPGRIRRLNRPSLGQLSQGAAGTSRLHHGSHRNPFGRPQTRISGQDSGARSRGPGQPAPG